mgnify:CR=1 FL=1
MITKRARQKLSTSLRYTFESGHATLAVAAGAVVKFGADDDTLVIASAGDPLAIGIVEIAQPTATRPVIVLLFGTGIVPVTVGTGGATRGANAITVADGFTNAATHGGGTTAQITYGKFLQTGVAGDIVGLLMQYSTGVSA